MSKQPISQVAPDHDLLVAELAKQLQQKGTWLDLLPTSVGTTIMDQFAAAGTMNQYYIEMSLREAFLVDALRDSSIFGGTRGLGVRISRRTPAATTVTVTNKGDETEFLPPYSQFNIGSKRFYNRSQGMSVPGQSTELNVYEGVVGTRIYDLDEIQDLNFYEFILGIENFQISNQDLIVWTRDKVSGETVNWTLTDTALYEHRATDAVFYEMTTAKGDVSLVFGDGKYGKALQHGHELHVRFVATVGADANSGLSGQTGTYVENPAVSVVTSSPTAGGANEKAAVYYKLFAPNMFRAKKRAVSAPDYRGIVMEYPGVADMVILAQKDIAPDDIRWMNTLRLCVLPENDDTWGGANPNPKSAAWKAFLDWFETKRGTQLPIQSWNPEKVFVDIRVVLAVEPGRDTQALKLKAMERLLKMFQKKPGTLGRTLNLSDITSACKVEGVDYVTILSPTEPIKPEKKTEYVVLRNTPNVEVVYSERTVSSKNAFQIG